MPILAKFKKSCEICTIPSFVTFHADFGSEWRRDCTIFGEKFAYLLPLFVEINYKCEKSCLFNLFSIDLFEDNLAHFREVYPHGKTLQIFLGGLHFLTGRC